MKLKNVAVATGSVLVFLVVLTRNLAGGIEYCDCTDVYKKSLPNGSHCANDTTFNTWTLECDPKFITSQRGAEQLLDSDGYIYSRKKTKDYDGKTDSTYPSKPAAESSGSGETSGETSGSGKRAGSTRQRRAETSGETGAAETGAESGAETAPAINQTEVALQLEEYKKKIHNYTAYNATLYPLNSTCQCNCTYGSYTNDTIYFIDSNQTATTTKVTESTKTVGESTVVTKITVTNNQYIQGWWKINSTTTTNVTTTTTGGITEETVSSSTKADNVSSHWLEVITVVGQCPLPEVIGLQCYNCLFIPSMNYSACLDPNKNCPYKCSKTVYQYLGIDYFVSSCYNDSRPNDCSSGSAKTTNSNTTATNTTATNTTASNTTDVSCAAELCSTDWCNTYVPLAGVKLVPNSLLLLLSFCVTLLLFHWGSARTVSI